MRQCCFSYTTLRLMCLFTEYDESQNKSEHTHTHKIKWKTAYQNIIWISKALVSKQSKMLPGKTPTLKLNNNESRLLCQDISRNICARQCNLFIYSQLRDNILMNKTQFSSRMTQRENQAHMCHSRVPRAGGLSPFPRFHTDFGEKANVL